MILRVAVRLFWFALEVSWAVVCYFRMVVVAAPKNKRLARAAWLQQASRRHLRIFNYRAEISGELPRQGLLVSNHLSYLDILALSAATPAVFVSKADVRRWPLFGWLAALAGTVFIERERRTHVGAVNQEIAAALADGALVVVFPEGTSSNGEQVLPFRSSLLEPGLRAGGAISVACLHYELTDGDARQEVCYWGDHTFFPHLLHLLGKSSIRAVIKFRQLPPLQTDRKAAATSLRAEVMALREV
ncbi:MAG TPA: lysophospholipid acyltransferase family protein [Verrucomicrobiae bacterium]